MCVSASFSVWWRSCLQPSSSPLSRRGAALPTARRIQALNLLLLGTTTPVYFRPVLCEAPPYEPAESGQSAQVSLSCSGASALTAQNLNIQPLSTPPSGFTTDPSRIPPDAALGGTPSTNPSHERTSATVLVPWAPGSHAGAVRYVLGPAQLTTASIEIGVGQEHRWRSMGRQLHDDHCWFRPHGQGGI